MPISTIGYEGSSIEDFLAILAHAGVEVLVDVRDLPLSRKKGFSKRALKEELSEINIGYLHLKALGDPKEGRDAARRGDFERFNLVFRQHLRSQDAHADLNAVADLSNHKHICLMCFERDHKVCHRSIVVEEIRKLIQIEVRHLGIPKGFGRKKAA